MTVKALQKQLIAAVAMVLVAVIAVSGSTFAWFAQNTSVTAQTITATAQSTELLRIATNNLGYSTSVELGLTVANFKPVSAGAELVKTGEFYKDTAWEDETVTSTSDAHSLAATFGAATAGTDYAVADLWITDNIQAGVYFSSKTNIIAKTTVTNPAYDPEDASKGLQYYDVYAQFVAGSALATVTLAKDTVLEFDGVAIDNDPVTDVAATTAAKEKLTNALGALRLTFVPYATAVAEDSTNNTNDTTASGAAASFYSFSSSTAGKYNTQNGTAGTNINADKRIASVDEGVATLEADSPTVLSNTTQLTSLNANEAKHYKVYCYLEGCDKQCITGIADDVVYTVSLGFAQASAQ